MFSMSMITVVRNRKLRYCNWLSSPTDQVFSADDADHYPRRCYSFEMRESAIPNHLCHTDFRGMLCPFR